MIRVLSRALLPAVPGLLGILVALPELPWSTPGLAEELSGQYALPVYLVAIVLAVAFHRSRVVALLALVAALDTAIRLGYSEDAAVPSLAIGLLPVFALGAWTRDRGLTSRRGVVQLVFCATWAAAWVGLMDYGAEVSGFDLVAHLTALGAEPSAWERATGFSDPLGLLAGAVILGSVAAVYRWRGPVEHALVWSLLFTLAAVHPATGLTSVSLLLMAICVTLALSVLQTSYAMAYRDDLTGLPARRALVRDLEGLRGTYTIAMVDVDHFKKFNDRHGHEVGDQVLKMVAGRLARAPAGGRAYRYGGEEFTLLYPGLTRKEAAPYLEAVRASVAAARFSLRAWTRPVRDRVGQARRGRPRKTSTEGRKLSVTVSIGAADSEGGGGAGPDAVLAEADKKLYKAKKGGRNRVAG